MKKLILVFLLLATVVVNAQIYYYDTKADAAQFQQRMNLTRKRIVENHIRSVKTYTCKSENADNSDKGFLSTEILYDAQGNITEFKELNKHGKIKHHQTNKWDDKNRIIEEIWFKSNGKIQSGCSSSYDTDGNLVEQRAYWHHPDDMIWHSVAKYDDKQNILELKYLKNNDAKVLGKYLYTYYPDGSKKQTTWYNGKGKVKYIWNYDCNPAGTQVSTTQKDTSKICVRYETDKDGNKIKIKEENVKQGAVVRVVSRYDKNDNLLDIVELDAAERSRYHYSAKYDEHNNRTEFAVYNGKKNKLKERDVLRYDTSGNLTEVVAYKTAAQPDRVMKYSYVRGE